VYRCLVHNHDDLDPACRKELARALHMALFIWAPGGLLTAPCDGDVAALCLAPRPSMDHAPGAVGACLGDIVSAACARCVGVWAGCVGGACVCWQQLRLLAAPACDHAPDAARAAL
jgi:Golgi apparatus protein 1